MKTRIKIHIAMRATFLTAGIFMAGMVCAQQVITNSNGQRIVIYPDGSWRSYEAADSVLLKTNLKSNETFRKGETTGKNARAASPTELEETALLAEEFAALTAREVREANRYLSKAVDEKFKLEAQLRQARENESLLNESQVEDLEQAFKDQEDRVGDAKKHLKKAEKFANKAADILKEPIEKQERSLAKLMVEHDSYFSNEAPRGISKATPSAVANAPVGTTVPKAARNSEIRSADRPDHLIKDYRRQSAECRFIDKSTDAKGGVTRATTAPQLLFTYTDPDLRPYFRDKELLTCRAQLTMIDDNVYFIVEFSIASPNAQNNFGILGDGNLMRLQLLDETVISLYNLQGDRGRIDAYSGNTIFVGRYKLEKDDQRALRKSGLDKMRVVWSSGYEDYDVYALDFFEEQLNCLESIQ